MIPPRAPFTRLLAALTPALLLWAFVGCAAVCAAHAEERRGRGVTETTVGVSDSHCSETCPVKEGFFLVPAKRFAPDQQAVSAQPVPAPDLQEPQHASSPSGRHSETLKPPEAIFRCPHTLRI